MLLLSFRKSFKKGPTEQIHGKDSVPPESSRGYTSKKINNISL